MSKRNVFALSLVGALLFLVAMFPVNMGICEKSSYECRKISDFIEMILGIFPLALFFSLITYKMPESVFRAWWSFARWFVPVIVLVTWLVNSSGGSGGMGVSGVIASQFEVMFVGLFYVVFVITSFVKIISERKRSK